MARGKKKWIALATAVSMALIGGSWAIKPSLESYATPLVKEELNSMINGRVDYDDLEFGWNGVVHVKNVQLIDLNQGNVVRAKSIDVALSPKSLLDIVWGQKGTASVVSDITIHQGDFHIWQEANKSWNFQNLLKDTSNDSNNTFDGTITIKDSQVEVQPLGGHLYKAEAINGTLDFSESPRIEGALQATFNQENINLRGYFMNDDQKDFDVFIATDKLDLNYLNDALKGRSDLVLDGGSLENIELEVKQDQGHIGFFGQVDLVNGQAHYGDYALTEAYSHLRFNQDTLQVSGGQAKFKGQVIKASGLVSIGSDSESALNLNAQVEKFDLSTLDIDGLSGYGSADIHVGGTTVKPSAIGSISFYNLTYDNYSLDTLKGDFSFEDDVVNFHDVEGQMGAGTIKGNGSYQIYTKDFEANVNAKSIDIAPFAATEGYDISGSLDADLYLKGQGTNLQGLVGRVEGKNLSTKGFTLDTLDAHITSDGVRHIIDYANASMGSGRFTAYGQIENDTIGLNFSGHSIPLAILNDTTNHAFDGVLTLNGQVTGNIHNLEGYGDLSTGEMTFDGSHFDSFYGEWSLANQNLVINKGHFRDGNGSYNVSGSIGLDDKKSLDLWLKANQVRLENVIKSFTDIPLTGWISSDNHITGTMNQPQVSGNLHWWDGSAYGKLVSNVTASYTYKNKVLSLDDFDLQAYGATVTGQGTYDGNNLNFDFLGDTIDLGRLLQNTDYHIDGYAAAHGQLRGTLDHPEFTGTIRSKALSVEGVPLTNLTGQLDLNSAKLEVKNFDFDEASGGHYHVSAGMTLGSSRADNHLFGQLNVTDGDTNNLLAMLGKEPSRMHGLLNGSLDLSGSVANPGIAVKGSINHVTFGQKEIGNAQVDLALSDHEITIHTLQLPIGNGLIAAGGRTDLFGTADIQIAANHVDVQDVIPIVTDEPVDASGQVSAVINISGKTLNPHAELSAELENGSYQGVTLDHAFALATMDNKIININQIMAQKDIYKVKAYGKVPFAALYSNEYLQPGDENGFDLTIDMNEADLAVLPLSTPWITKGVGPLQGSLHITGSYDQPEVNGDVKVVDGTLHIKDVGKDLEHVNAIVSFKNQMGTFQLDGRMGKGDMGASGQLSWSGHHLQAYQGALQMKNLDVDNEYIAGPINGEFYATEVDGRPTIMGNLDLKDTTFKIPLSFDSTDSTSDLGLDIRIHAGDNVKLYDPMLYEMTIAGDVHLAGTTANPSPSGSFVVKRGIFKYLSNRFDIMKGTATFTDGSLLPYLKLSARTMRGNYRVMVGVEGFVDNLSMHLTSDPALDEGRIVSLLTFGNSRSVDNGLSEDDANNVLVAGLQMLTFGYVEDKVRNVTGLDSFSVTTGSLNKDEADNKVTTNYYNLEIGKYLIPNLMVKYSRGINNDNYVYTLQYDVDRHLSLTGWKNSDNHSFGGMKWSRDF